jgi:hypothetical protein
LVDGAKTLFAEDGLKQDQAQRYVSYFNEKVLPKIETQIAERNLATWENTKSQWRSEFDNDPTIGGNRRDTTVNAARFGIRDVIGADEARLKEFRDMQEAMGIGNHRAEIGAWAEVGRRMQQIYDLTGTDNWTAAMKKLSEPSAPPPSQPARPSGGPGSAADRRYGRR